MTILFFFNLKKDHQLGLNSLGIVREARGCARRAVLDEFDEPLLEHLVILPQLMQLILRFSQLFPFT